MIKNRIRTAALAGAIAVATGVSGLAVPAMAQDAQVATAQFTVEDGSAAVSADPQNIDENELRELTDATGDYLRGWDRADGVRDIVRAYLETGEAGFDPSEEAAQAAFEGARADAAAQLATSAENITKARQSVAFALQADHTATNAWNALRGALDDTRDVVNPLIEATNEANRYQGEEFWDFEALYTTGGIGHSESDLAAAYRDLLELRDDINTQYETAGEWQIDDRYNRVTREHMAALDVLKEEVDAQVAAIEGVYQEAIDTNREAQRSDVLVRQLYLERATAQRDTLRVVEATFRTAARQVELYGDNDTLVGNDEQSLRGLYTALLAPNGPLLNGLSMNLDFLDEADRETYFGHDAWWTDLGNNADGRFQIYREHLTFASESYSKIFANATVWQNELSRVELLDQKAADEVAEREAEREAEKAAAEEAARQAKEAAEREERIAKALEELAKAREEAGKDNGNNNGDDNDDDDVNEGSSEGSSVGGLGIFAALAGVVGLIAAAFPFVSNFLNLNR
ncbi:S-layer protein PS2 [Corynebacterium halotolerans]|uniref:Uncharacterized protein n=1 Tax=Corynebacterium halotolerans YIM 70093 = DSM 44683 TaxID=1121362 RepID=M1NPW6_9CORY|nr:S-layer protein PS2 [Corynebacterium halotolerans]AGF73428.1 hypothetical protein A605_12160 [Corynebacterium halotolerans YIM 70093 = DSM 44683]